MLHFILVLIISVLMASERSETASETGLKVFSCQSRHSMFDPDFQQGSEIYLDVLFYESSGKVAISYWPADGARFILYSEDLNTRSIYHSQSSVVLEWETTQWKTYASMQYLGGSWGFANEIPENYDKPEFAGQDLEIWCDETKNTSKFLQQIKE